MFTGYRWEVKRWLRAGKNELSVRFDSAMKYIRSHRPGHLPREFNDPVGRSQVIRKQQCQFGWDWGPRFVTAGHFGATSGSNLGVKTDWSICG